MDGMIQVLPECTIPCVDLWHRDQFPPHKMQAYKVLRDEGRIIIRHVTYHKPTGWVTVEYFACLPQAWIHNELAQIANRILKDNPGQQLTMGGGAL